MQARETTESPSCKPPVTMVADCIRHDNDLIAFPPPPRLLREIRDDWWEMGRTLLRQQPERGQVRVAFHGPPHEDYWEFWVVRGPNNTFLQRTMRNYHVERDTPMRE